MNSRIFDTLAQIVKNASGLDMNRIDIETDYINLGFDSLVVVRIDQGLQKEFGIEIEMGLYYDGLDSLAKLLAYLTEILPTDWSEVVNQDVIENPLSETIPTMSKMIDTNETIGDNKNSNDESFTFKEKSLSQAMMEKTSVTTTGTAPTLSGLNAVLSSQMQAMADLMHRQLDVLQSYGYNAAPDFQHIPAFETSISSKPDVTVTAHSMEKKIQGQPPTRQQDMAPAGSDLEASKATPPNPSDATSADNADFDKPKIAEIRAMKFDPDHLNDDQLAFLDKFIPPYIERTQKSKAYAQTHRPALCDWINTLGFRRSIKEMVYPIVSERSSGSRFWDIDGNVYLDLAMGYGVNLLGHSPDFVTKALQKQIEIGIDLGPQNKTVGEVARMISRLTGMERVAFCNTGSEAVMMALRAAQTLTGKDRIALFTGSYHGNADLVIKDTQLLRYGDDSAFDIIRDNAHELAAVLVEPVQSRNPSLQPKEFLHRLRALTKELGIILIFDEMINGFRCHPGGAQAVFGVRADMATYGKAPAGGMPIGIVAGSGECMRVIDGGLWDYSDDSTPGDEVIFFGGTFCKHPLAMAATHASLTHMIERGEALQFEINERTTRFANAVNDFFEKEKIGIRVSWFASQFIFEPTLPLFKRPVPPPDLTVWFHVMLFNGVYTWERRICFFSEAHTDADVDLAIAVVKKSSLALKAAGFPLFNLAKISAGDCSSPSKTEMPTKAVGKAQSRTEASHALIKAQVNVETNDAKGENAPVTIPLTQAQQQLWFLSQLNENAVPAYIETIAVRLNGALDRDHLSMAVKDLVTRHPALRTVIDEEGRHQHIMPVMESTVKFTDASDAKAVAGNREKSENSNQDTMAERVNRGKIVPLSDIGKTDFLSKTMEEEWLLENSRSTLDLVNGPLFSFKLLRIEAETHLLAMNFHHIVMDGRSVNVLLRDLLNFYAARVKGNPIDVEGMTAPPDLRNYQTWLEEYLCSDTADGDRSYWERLFPNAIPMMDFPTDHARSSLFSFKGARHHLKADPELLKSCIEIGKKRKLTPFMTLISLYTLWLHKLTGKDEIVIGFPVAGRFFPGSHDLVGYCTHLVPFLSRYDADAPFESYLDSARQTLTRAYGHQQYPFSELIGNLDMEQDLSRGSVIASEFNLDQMQNPATLEGLSLSLVDIPLSYAKYDLCLEIMEVAGRYQFKFEYATDLFDHETIVRMADHFATLMAAVAEHPDAPVAELSLLTPAEKETLLLDWNRTERPFPLDRPFHRIFEDQVRETPDKIAVTMTEPDAPHKSFTYAELNGHANGLAGEIMARLGKPAITPFTGFTLQSKSPLIPILADRSPEFVMAMIGIFKAGRAYLPLDPDHPADRIHAILSQTNSPMIMVQKKYQALLDEALGLLSENERPPILWFEDAVCVRSLTKADFENLGDIPGIDPTESLAYVIFTSGSTGAPKGAMVQQKGMVNHIYAKIEDLGIAGDDVVAQNASQCFDISVWQFLAALLTGGRIQIMGNETAHDPDRLISISSEQGVTILEVVPSLLRVLLEQMDANVKFDPVVDTVAKKTSEVENDSHQLNRTILNKLRWLVPTGEALPPSLCTQWFTYFPNTPILNAYGPTECSDDVAHYALYEPPGPNVSNIPIGMPVANMQLYILDAHMKPVPIGVAGELWVGGVGVGLGYLGRKDLTDKAFVPNIFSDDPTAKLYKTGDLAQYLPDGNILFLGRQDHQVKIRGFRIELEEIEAVLARHPMVREQVVTAVDVGSESENFGASDQVALAAYVVFFEDSPENTEITEIVDPFPESEAERIEILREHISDSLPGYMVPSYFVALPSLPLTSNGKIDRKVLPKPTSVAVESATPFAPPKNETETALCQVLTDVLNRPQIGIHDNYFSLGGDSIKAIQVVARIQSHGFTMKLRDIFQYPTVAELALRLTRRTRMIDQGPVTGTVLPTPLQKWLLHQDNAVIHHYNQGITLTFDETVNVTAVERAIDALMIHHDALRITVKEDLLNIEGTDLKPELTVIPFDPDLDIETEMSYANKKLNGSINLSNGPLFRCALIRGNASDQLIMVAHHLAVDAISWPILVADFMTAYGAVNRGETIRLPEKTDAFKFWSDALWHLASPKNSPHTQKNSPTLPPLIKETIENPLEQGASSFLTLENEETRWTDTLASDREYWESLASTVDPHQRFSKDVISSDALQEDTDLFEVILPVPDTTMLVGKAHQAYHTDMNDLLLTALGMGLRHWTGLNGIPVDMEGHGRDALDGLFDENVDISRTVGWFTASYPIILKLPETTNDMDLGTPIKWVKESLRQVPNSGITYGLVHSDLSNEAKENLRSQVSFNYLGAVDDASGSDLSPLPPDVMTIRSIDGGATPKINTPPPGFKVEAASHMDLIHPKMKRPYLLEVEAEIRKEKLHVQLYYSKTQYDEDSIRQLGGAFKDALIRITDHCMGHKTPEMTPSDLTWPHLTLSEFETLLDDLHLDATQVQDLYPLTPMQENMLFHRLSDSHSTAYFEQFSFLLTGSVDLALLQRSWHMVCERHDILRTNFIYKSVPTPLQLVHRTGRMEWHYQDLTANRNENSNAQEQGQDHKAQSQKVAQASVTPSTPMARFHQLKLETRNRGFDLTHDTPMRMHIYKLESGDVDTYGAVWSYHHILMDGWCLGLLIQDVQSVYLALKEGKTPKLSPAPQYREYIQWLEKANHDDSMNYWNDYLDGFSSVTSLPRDVVNDLPFDLRASTNEMEDPPPPPDLQHIHRFELDDTLSDHLKRLAEEHRITFNTLIQCIWGVLLAERNGVSDVAFGAAVSGRPAEMHNVERIVGLFLNTVPVRMQLSDADSFIDLIETVQTNNLSGEPHHYISLAAMQTACGTEGALVDHVLIFQNYPLSDELETLQKQYPTGYSFHDLDAVEQTSFDLSVEIYPNPVLHFDLRYNPGAYSLNAMERLQKDLTTLLANVSDTNEITIGDLRRLLRSEEELDAEADFLASAMSIDDDF